jgi:hypothetical protein
MNAEVSFQDLHGMAALFWPMPANASLQLVRAGQISRDGAGVAGVLIHHAAGGQDCAARQGVVFVDL